LVDVSLSDAVEAISADFMSFDTGNHRELVEVSADWADEFSLFEVADELLVLVAPHIETEQVLQPLLFGVEIDFRAFLQFFDHTLAAHICGLLVASFAPVVRVLLFLLYFDLRLAHLSRYSFSWCPEQASHDLHQVELQ
jgi:hypothetical protein